MAPEPGSLACPICGSDSVVTLHWFSAHLGLTGATQARVRRCGRCGFGYLAPYPSTQLAELYSREYFEGGSGSGGSLGVPRSGEDYARTAELRSLKFARSLEFIRQQAPHAGTLFDVGAATGDFVALCRSSGLEAEGLELSAWAAQQAQDRHGVTLFVGDLEDYPLGRRFDVIHLSHVLEHLVRPTDAVQRLDRLLAADGVIYIEVPLQLGLVTWIQHHLLRKRQPFTLFSIHHANFFTPATLRALFARQGFHCIALRVFDPVRYGARGIIGRAKAIVWSLLARLYHGHYIEALFARDAGRSRDVA